MPGAVLILTLVIAVALALLLFWLLSGAPSRPPQYG